MFSYMLGKGGMRGGAFSWLQSATSPLDATKSSTLVLLIKADGATQLISYDSFLHVLTLCLCFLKGQHCQEGLLLVKD